MSNRPIPQTLIVGLIGLLWVATATWTSMADRWEVDLTACTLAGDLDCNCRVDVADIQRVARHWGIAPGQPGYHPPYDPDHDGIDAADIQGVALGWRGTCAPLD